MAQAPNKFTYQAVVRNTSNQLVTNTLVGIRISILQNSATGGVVYSETQMLSTNSNGLVTLNIGEGSAVYGSLNNVNWGNGVFFLKSEIDPNGGSSYSITSTQQLLSVPYALYANEAGNGFSGDYNDLTNLPQIPQIPADVSAFNNDAGYITMDSVPAIPTQVSVFTNDAGYITSADLQGLLTVLNSRMDSLQTVVSSQNAEMSTLIHYMDSIGAFADSLGTILEECGCGQQANVCDVATVTDYDGNVYNTVGIGSQCWLKENLRTTHYSDGTAIELGTTTDLTTPYRYKPDSDPTTVAEYGYLYNWKAVMRDDTSSNENPSRVQGICPKGWHVPSKAEWTQLFDYVSGQANYVCGNDTQNIARALSATYGWNGSTNNCTPGKYPEENNVTGFSILPAGYYNGGSVTFGNRAYIWSASEYSHNSAWSVYLQNMSAQVDNETAPYKYYGNSVRCIRNIVSDDEMSEQLEGLLDQISQLQSHIDSLETLLMEGAILTTYECGTSTVSDYDGNVYNTVGIGNQCWMKENLRTTHYSNGTSIALGTSYGVSTPARYYPNHDSVNVGIYGYLYNWAAVMNGAVSSNANPSGVRGICPLGWHVPSEAEWTQMENYVSSQDQYLCNNSTSNIAKALTSATGWNSSSAACAVGNDLSANNATGFSAMPAGDCHYNWGYENFGNGTLFWTSTENSSNGNAWRRHLSYNAAVVNRDNKDKGNGFSVRCLRDNGVGGLAVAHNGDETANQIEDLQQQILQMQTRIDSLEARADSLGTVTDSLGSLMDECGCSAFECGVTPLLDYDSNTYNTVQLGSKCWMAENLRTTHYSNGLPIELGSYSDGSVPYRYYPNNNSANVENYGYLYNWAAVMHGAASSDANPSKVQGVCPKGWHVPSSAEWTELTTYVSGQSQYLCDNNTANIAKALASTTGWNTNSTTCAVGNNPSVNNATGFGAMPAGDRHYNWGFENFGNNAIFWSATEAGNGNGNAGRFLIGHNSASTDFSYKDRGNGFSVRCVHN